MAAYGTPEWAKNTYGGGNYYQIHPEIAATARRVTQTNNAREAESAQQVALQPYFNRLRAYKYSTPELYDPRTGLAYQEHGVSMANPYISRLYDTFRKQLSMKYGGR